MGTKRENPVIETNTKKSKILKQSIEPNDVKEMNVVSKSQSEPNNVMKKKSIKKTSFNGRKDNKFHPKSKTLISAVNSKADEPKDWKKLKLEKKELRMKRRSQQKPHFGLSIEMKKIYEVLKRKSTTKENKEELAEKLYNLLKDNIKSFVMAHDTARIVQCVLKKSNSEIKMKLSQALIPLSVEMSVSKYAHFCVHRMLKYGDKQIKTKIIENLYGSLLKLTMNRISNSIIDKIYTTYATEPQKNLMRQEFYGEMYKKHKDSSIKKLSDTYKDSPELKTPILNAVKVNLEQIANKNVVDNSLVHALFYEYIQECNENDIEELINAYTTKIPLLLTTRDGCKVGILLFWKASTKDRRAIVKSIKEHLMKICVHEHGHMFLIAVLNSMDDTKAIKKQIFDPLLLKLNEIVSTQWGRKVIEWLISPGNKDYFHPKLIEYFDEGLKYGKKSSDLRRKEIFEQVIEPITNEIMNNTEFWLSDGHIGLITVTILKKLNSDNFSNVAKKIAMVITNPEWEVIGNKSSEQNKLNNNSKIDVNFENNNESHLGIEDSGLHIVLKKIIKNDSTRLSTNESTFGEFVVENLSDETIKSWIKINRACFILLNILENCKDETRKQLIKLMTTDKQNHFNNLKSENHPGAKFLFKKLNSNE